MKTKITKILIAKDGWPLEQFVNKPIINFIRKIIHGDHYECRDCWYGKQATKNTYASNTVFSAPTKTDKQTEV